MRRSSGSVKSTRGGRSSTRDVYGFEVPAKLVRLYSKQSGTRTIEEKHRTDKWLQFLYDISPRDHAQKNALSAGFFDEQMARSLKEVIASHKSGPGTELGHRLDTLVQNGIPSFLRGHIWSVFLGYDIERDPGLFAFLSSQVGRSDAAEVSPEECQRSDSASSGDESFSNKRLMKTIKNEVFSAKQMEILEDNNLADGESINSEKTVDQINKDLNRTFPGHPVMDENGLSVLREILVAFSLHRPDIGYCQGMNFISGLLLLFNKPEDAFWNLVAITERLLPNQFDSDMLPAVVDKSVFKHLVHQQFPKLAAHLEEMAVDVSFLCPHWFLCCFVNALPTESCLRVWDILFWQRNPTFLFKVGLALVDLYSENLKKANNAATAWDLLQNMARSSFDSNALIKTALDKFPQVEEQCITDLRISYHNKIKQKSAKGSGFGMEDQVTDEYTTPTKIQAGSRRLLRYDSSDSSPSTGSTFFSEGQHCSNEFSAGLGTNSSLKLVQELLGSLQENKDLIPEGVGSKVYELISSLRVMESENRQLQMKLNEASTEEKRIIETNQALKLRLGAAYTELDKKSECLESMIAKSQLLTEKVASQEEIICKQRRLLFNRSHTSAEEQRGSVAAKTTRSAKNLKSLLFSGK